MRRDERFPTIRCEGGLLPADLLARVAAGDKTVEALSPLDYHLAPGERLNEAITRSWNRMVGAWAAFAGGTGTVSGRAFSLTLFQELGYGQLQPARKATIDGRDYPISHRWESVPVHLVSAGEIDRRTPGVAGAAAMSPHALLQEYLNRTEEHLWGFVCNGLRLRLLRDNASLTRQSFVDFDLEAMFVGGAYPDFVALWLVCHQSRVEGQPPEKCVLERWRADAAERGTRALEHLRLGVESAIAALGAGFLSTPGPGNAALMARLRDGDLDKQDYYRQLLRLVYRLLFLFVAEERNLLLVRAVDDSARHRYLQFYSLGRVRRLADTRRGSPHIDLWSGLRVVFEGLALPGGRPELALPALGGFLWSDRAIPDLADAGLANRDLLAAVRALSFVRDGRTTHAVNYYDLDAEELGSIYESLLELHPQLHLDGSTFTLATAGGNERKTTGSYYTPSSLISELMDSALEPVLDEAMTVPPADREAALLAVRVLDPACGSGHFLIAAARRIAKRLAAVREAQDKPDSDPSLNTALRDVIGRCLYGVDLNEMAVELCKVSLWMEAMDPGKPLSFLDHRIVCGNSLLGTTPRLLAEGVPDEAFKPITGDDKAVVAALKKHNKLQRGGQAAMSLGPSIGDLLAPVADEYSAIDALPDSTMAEVEEKARRWAALQHSPELGRATLAADAWCSAFVAPKVTGAPQVLTAFVWAAAEQPLESLDHDVVAAVELLRAQYRFLHLHVAFPDVFHVPADLDEAEHPATGWDGGFSIVLGNPPWEHAELKEKEWFAERMPEIASAATGAARKRLIAALVHDEPQLHLDFLAALRQADAERFFFGASGRFPLCGRGRINTFSVFAEHMRNAISSAGRVGVIVPSGIATDDTTKHFFGDLVGRRSLVSLFDFENAAPLFAGVHRSFKFCLLTLTGDNRPASEAEFVFFAHGTADLTEPERRFTLSPDDFSLLNPNTRTCPVFRTRRDAELTKAIYRRVPVLIAEGPPVRNPWGVTFRQGLFNMTSDSSLFRTRYELEVDGWRLEGNVFVQGDEHYLPLYEAKMLHHFDHRWATYDGGDVRDLTSKEKSDPCSVALPRYWVIEQDVTVARRSGPSPWLLAFRDITNSTNERTVIASALPNGATGNKAPLIFTLSANAALLAPSLVSLAHDFVARFKIGGATLNFFIVKQVPVLPPEIYDRWTPWSRNDTLADWLLPRVLELTYTAWDLEGFARGVGHDGPPFRWDDDRRALLRAELDACFFHLYGIERDDIDYIMETFPIVKRKDLAANNGEYVTKRRILDCYDAMAEAAEGGEPYATILDPPPADPSVAHDAATRPAWADLLSQPTRTVPS